MAADPKSKIDEMLRKKREKAGEERASTASAVQPAQPAPAPQRQGRQTSFEQSEQHGSVMERINAMLKKKSAEAPQTRIENAPSPAHANVQADRQPIAEAKPNHGLCPSCAGEFALNDGIYICASCSRRFTRRVSDAALLDCSLLHYGVCRCCEFRRPLIKSGERRHPVCSLSGEEHVSVNGFYMPFKELPFGLCSCCETPFPLAATNAGKICCPVSGSQYVRNADGTIAPMPKEIDLPAADSIEDALNAGNAAFYYGGFIGGAEQEQPTRRRRRR